jgi:protein-S-isoprenylcysteine O-methyltransferase Ste14
MERKRADFIMKKYHIVPLLWSFTFLSIFFWFNNFQQNWIYFTGLAINILGLFIWWSAKVKLAENWYPGWGQPKIKKLITGGVYSKICHPIYWGINLTLIGISLIHPNIYLIIPSMAIIAYFFWRMKIETKFLIKTLGKRYLDYKDKTWI